MKAALKRRISELERRVALIEDENGPDALSTEGMSPAEFKDSLYQLDKELAFIAYDTWRHQVLSLEERLALARDDDAREQADPQEKWSPGRWQVEDGKWVATAAAIAAREIEVRILERDGRIDDATARALRDNAREHFFGRARDNDKRSDATPLDPLPHPVEIDQEKLLASALRKCPRRESLTLEEQLELVHEEHRRDLARLEERDKNPSPRWPGYQPPTPGIEVLFDGIHQYAVRELEQKIRERDSRAA